MPSSFGLMIKMPIPCPWPCAFCRYFNDREKWNQLDNGDITRMYRQIAWWYEFLHEATRPLWVEQLPVKDTMFFNTGGEVQRTHSDTELISHQSPTNLR